PDVLTYLWIQLDENEHSNVNNANYQNSSRMPRQMNEAMMSRLETSKEDNGYGFNILKVTDGTNNTLSYIINKTMMRIDLPQPLKPGQKYVLNIDWTYKITDRLASGGRGGYEYFAEDGNYLFTMAQWYPRLAVYSDFKGWQN